MVIPCIRSAAEVRVDVRLFNDPLPPSLWEELRGEELKQRAQVQLCYR